MQEQIRRHHTSRKLDGTELEKLFGNNTIIHKFARFYEQYQDEFELISAVKLNEFVSDPKNEFSSGDIDFYKKGQAEIPLIFAACHEEIERKKQEEEAALSKQQQQ